MSNDFDLFGSNESDNLQEELAHNSYEWTNTFSWVLAGLLVFTGGVSSGIWYATNQNDTSSNKVNFAAQRIGQNANSDDKAGSPKGGNKGGGQNAPKGFSPSAVGTIKKVEGEMLEIETKDGVTVKILSSGETKVISSSADSFASLKIGDMISVIGASESDGAINSLVITKGELVALEPQGAKAKTPSLANPSAQPGGGKPEKKGEKGGGKGKGKGAGKSSEGGSQSGQGSANTTSQTTTGPSAKQKPAGGGGGGLNNPEFKACLDKRGVVIKEGERPNMEDPEVATAIRECRSVLPPRKGGGQGGGSVD